MSTTPFEKFEEIATPANVYTGPMADLVAARTRLDELEAEKAAILSEWEAKRGAELSLAKEAYAEERAHMLGLFITTGGERTSFNGWSALVQRKTTTVIVDNLEIMQSALAAGVFTECLEFNFKKAELMRNSGLAIRGFEDRIDETLRLTPPKK